MEYFAIDFETANGYHNSACSVGVVRFVDGKEKDSVYSLIKPAKMYFKPEFIDIHHISYDDVRDKPQFPEVWQTIIVPFLGTERNEKKQINFIAHNARFDMDVIRSCCNYYGMPLPNANYACTLQIARRTWKDFNCHALTFLAEQFGIVYDAHNALDDARTCGRLFAMAAEKNGLSQDELFFQKNVCKNLSDRI
ncbi:MAG: 3'-5' exonuclease [Spirochaetaceae bacterium]|nr:3'-5' exonuclease [Spirochaetaceae bacterium]